MDALIPRREKVEELNDYQKRLIVSVALKQTDAYPKRAERLKKIGFCTDAVKFEVLRNEPKINDVLYAELHRLYFSEANRSEPPQRSSVVQGPGWKEIEAKPRALTENEARRLIELYNQGTKPREIGVIFNRTPQAINSLIYAYKHQDRYKELFKMDKEKAAPKPQEQEKKFEEIIESVDAGKPQEQSGTLPNVPKVFTARGKGFLTTDGGLKLDEEPITSLLRQTIIQKGLMQFYADVEIRIIPTKPTGMVVQVEE